jgi:drug/metabolite transporter (DMT)-like permease
MPAGGRLSQIDGRLWALIAASSLGLNTTLASLAYAAGTTPLLVAVVRALAAALLLGFWLKGRGKPFFHRPEAGPLALATLATLGVSLGYLGSVFFIPVSLAAIVFYTYPLVVAFAQAALERRLPRPKEAALFVVAFAGLLLAIGPSFQGLDWRGIVLAATASLSAAALFIVAARRLGHLDDMAVSFQVNLFGGLLAAAGGLLVLPSLFAFPASAASLGLVAAISLAYLLGVTTLFTAVKTAGPAKSALIFNIEPVVSIAMAFLLLGERLSPLQLLGGGLVIAALLTGSLERRRHEAPPPPGRPA